MTSHVYAVVGSKGGVGKTTTSINIGATLGAAGYSAIVVELDLAMANVVDFLNLDIDVREATTLHDVLAGNAPVDEACYEVTDGFSVALSGTDLRGYVGTDLSGLPGVLKSLQWYYDVVLLDTPAGLSEESTRPLEASDRGLLVSTPRLASVRNAENTLELAECAGTEICGLVLTKSGTGASPGADRIAESLGVDLLGHVPHDEAVPHSQDAGEPVVTHAPRSSAADAYRKIAKQLAEEMRIPTKDPSNFEVSIDADSPETDTRPIEWVETRTPALPPGAADRDHGPGTAGRHPVGRSPAVDSMTDGGRGELVRGPDGNESGLDDRSSSPEGVEPETETGTEPGNDDTSEPTPEDDEGGGFRKAITEVRDEPTERTATDSEDASGSKSDDSRSPETADGTEGTGPSLGARLRSLVGL